MDGRLGSIFVRLSTHLLLVSSTSRGDKEEVCRETLARVLPGHSSYGLVPRRSTIVVILPSSWLTSSLPSHASRGAAKALRDSARAACFWPFLPELQKRPKNTQARPLPSEGERFQGRVFCHCFFLK